MILGQGHGTYGRIDCSRLLVLLGIVYADRDCLPVVAGRQA
jgi:hypothetical protein